MSNFDFFTDFKILMSMNPLGMEKLYFSQITTIGVRKLKLQDLRREMCASRICEQGRRAPEPPRATDQAVPGQDRRAPESPLAEPQDVSVQGRRAPRSPQAPCSDVPVEGGRMKKLPLAKAQ